MGRSLPRLQDKLNHLYEIHLRIKKLYCHENIAGCFLRPLPSTGRGIKGEG